MTADPAPIDATGAPGPAPSPRLESVDLLRGVVMVVMALDHVRDFVMDRSIDPTDLDATTPALFLTRWITHFCAPTFVYLAGVAAFLSGTRGRSRRDLSSFLATRGAWLLLLDQVWTLPAAVTVAPRTVFAIILWAIGGSMIALAALIHLPRAAILLVGLSMIGAHNLLDDVHVGGAGPRAIAWRILHDPGPTPLPGGWTLLVIYPLVPWIGVMAVGYASGPILLAEPRRRRRVLTALGCLMIAGFLAVRGLNRYGDPAPWSPRGRLVDSTLSFLNCSKYPPSLDYLLMTLGPALLLLACLDRIGGRRLGTVRTFGRVPLFYFLLQWPLALAVGSLLKFGIGRLGVAIAGPPSRASAAAGLPTTYLAWVVVVLLLVPPCRWFADVKRRRKDAWLSYL